LRKLLEQAEAFLAVESLANDGDHDAPFRPAQLEEFEDGDDDADMQPPDEEDEEDRMLISVSLFRSA
jgi:hypothetical protein